MKTRVLSLLMVLALASLTVTPASAVTMTQYTSRVIGIEESDWSPGWWFPWPPVGSATPIHGRDVSHIFWHEPSDSRATGRVIAWLDFDATYEGPWALPVHAPWFFGSTER